MVRLGVTLAVIHPYDIPAPIPCKPSEGEPMHTRRSASTACWICALLTLCAAVGALRGEDIDTPTLAITDQAPPPDADGFHHPLALVLARVVKPDGVDYAALRADHGDLDRYRVLLARTWLPDDASARKALWIDAYNAWTLALVERSLPRDQTKWRDWSIKDLGSLTKNTWKSYTFELAHARYTLDQVENEILRPMNDPRIHMAINCASRSCPPIATLPYVPSAIDAQLDAAAGAFASSDYHARVEKNGKSVRVNPILDWYAKDFAVAGDARAFLISHMEPGKTKDALQAGAKIAFFDYDWKLNLAGPSTEAPTTAPPPAPAPDGAEKHR